MEVREMEVRKMAETSTCIREMYMVSDWGDEAQARRARDRRARELRKLGFTVECKKWDFTDVARDIGFGLEAWKGNPPIISGKTKFVRPSE